MRLVEYHELNLDSFITITDVAIAVNMNEKLYFLHRHLPYYKNQLAIGINVTQMHHFRNIKDKTKEIKKSDRIPNRRKLPKMHNSRMHSKIVRVIDWMKFFKNAYSYKSRSADDTKGN